MDNDMTQFTYYARQRAQELAHQPDRSDEETLRYAEKYYQFLMKGADA